MIQLRQLCDHVASSSQTQAAGNSTSTKMATELVSKMASNFAEALDQVASLEEEQEEVMDCILLFIHDIQSQLVKHYVIVQDQQTLSEFHADVAHLNELWKTVQVLL